MTDRRAVLVVGGGLIGAAVRRHLERDGWTVTTARRFARSPADLVLDVAGEEGRRALAAALTSGGYDTCVLVHGPSDVTWCDSNEPSATATHAGTAAAAAGSGVAVVLVSTDNVFPGSRPGYGVDAPVEPHNAYGRAKARAERAVLAGAAGRVVRVSLVYGTRDDSRLRANFAEDCLLAARAPAGPRFEAPVDQAFTPIFVEDAAAAIAYVVRHPGTPPLVHAAGRQTSSRFEFAREAFRVAGADPRRVLGVPRAATRWASRPRYSCLEETASALDPRLCPQGIEEGLARTWSAMAGHRWAGRP
jgi:dTDP-4-dehydrorhamnose reductase